MYISFIDLGVNTKLISDHQKATPLPLIYRQLVIFGIESHMVLTVIILCILEHSAEYVGCN